MDSDERYDFEDFIENTLGLYEISEIYCTDFQNHQCYNKTCDKIHIRLDKAVVCKHWLRGLCKRGKNCEFLHEYDLKRMPECWFFSKYGECSNNECVFLHIDPNAARECLWYKRGFCRNGGYCRNKHVKKKICPFYLCGFCPEGENCLLGHARFDVCDMPRVDVDKDIIPKAKNIVE